MPDDWRTWYVKRTTWRKCEHGDRVATCYHTPRCGPLRVTIIAPVAADAVVFGRLVTGWTRVRGSAQAEREAAAWRREGWDTETMPTSPAVRDMVRIWESRGERPPRRVKEMSKDA
jgi:hypothetical protein